MCFRPPVAEKAKKKCPKCETLNPSEAEVCSLCGAVLPKAIAVPPPGVSAKDFKPPAPPAGVPPKAPPAPPKAPPAAPRVPPKKPEDQ